MSTIHENPPPASEARATARRGRPSSWLIGLVVVLVLGVLSLGVTMVWWSIDETRFDRPDPGFDALVVEIDDLPGVDVDAADRWVEAPVFFAQPRTWMQIEVEDDSLEVLLDTVCTTDHPDRLSLTLRVSTAAGTALQLYSGLEEPPAAADPCPDFGFDVPRLLAELDRVAPGTVLQATFLHDGQFSLSAFETHPLDDYRDLLPVVGHVDELRAAAGLAADETVMIESAGVSVTIGPGADDDHLALLTTLADDHEVTSFAVVPDASPPADGVQVHAPAAEHAAIERRIAESGLPFAAFPVRFWEP